jgi:exosortase
MDAWLAAALTLWLAALVGLCLLLQPQWSGNPELLHGYLMPLALLLLVREARAQRSGSPAVPLAVARWLCAGLSILALLSSAFGLLYALAFGWSHALACGPLTLAFVCLSLILLLGLASRGLVAFGWPAFCSAGLWLLCTPLPPGSYARISVTLQLAVTQVVMGTLGILGIPAARHGNVIEMLRGSVGVEEACSGIRSLITCLFAALLLSAALRMKPWRRALLLGVAPALAWCLNLHRSLILTLLTATEGPPTQAWHDGLGYAALGIATLCLVWLAFRLEAPPATVPPSPPSSEPIARHLPSRMILGFLLPACALTAAFLFLPRQAAPSDTPVPPLEEWLSPRPEGWEVRNGSLSEGARRVLGTTSMLQREYLRTGDRSPVDLVLYAAYWAPGRSSPSGVALHTPEVCWPGAGWTELPAPAKDPAPELAEAEYRRFRHESGLVQELWYWHFDGTQVVHGLSPYSAHKLIRNSLHQGFAPPRAQLFLRISSNRPWSEIRDSEPVRKLLSSAGISGLSTTP